MKNEKLIYIQLLFTVYTVDKTQISVQLQQNTKAIYSTSINEQFETNLS